MARNQSKNSLLNKLKKINRFAQMLRDDRFRQHRINSKKIYNRNYHVTLASQSLLNQTQPSGWVLITILMQIK
jgi:hypothetical protein